MSDPSLDRDPFEGVAESFLARFRAGERPSIAEYAARYPGLADQIRRLLPALVLVEQDLSVDDDIGAAPAARHAIDGRSQHLGDYRILREIGRGGMGVVYEATQVSLGRRVALKVLPHQVAHDPRALERFRREAKSAARLHHTNIVPVFEVGQDGETAYYAMQFIQGQGLDQIIDELARLRDRDHDRVPVSPVPTAAATAAGPGEPALSRAAGLLLTGRLANEGAVPTPCDTPASAGPSTERPGPDPSSAHSPAVAGRDDFVAGGAHASRTSAVLPGGAEIATTALSGRRPPFFRSVAQIVRQAAQGLAHAHSRGVIHRDIKPSNLLLDHAGVVWITDFGLAKRDDDGLTATGDIIGTLRYMAPERFRGAGDARADIYALGLSLYELLTLRPAFDTSDRLEMIERIKTEEPARPRSLDGRIPRDLETIVLKAIEKNPIERYPSAEAMGEDLGRFLADEPIRARQVSATERYWRWARRNPVIAGLGGVLAAFLVLVTIGSLLAAGRFARLAESQRSAALAERSARREASRREQAESRVRARADQARAAAQAETYRAMLSEVKALRAGHQPGWREEALASLARLGLMPTPRRDVPELRTEAAATLATPDIQVVAQIALPSYAVGVITFSPDGRTLLTCDRKTGFNFWDVPRKCHLYGVPGVPLGLKSPWDQVVYLPDGQGLAVATRDQGVVFMDTRGNHMPCAPITQGKNHPARLAISRNGQRLAIAWTENGGTTVHEAASGDLVDHFDGAGGTFALSPDGKWLARPEGGDIVLRPIARSEPRIVLGRHGGAVALDFSPNGALVAAAFNDHTTVLWNVAKREQQGALRGHREQVLAVAFSPDGEWIATGSRDYTARIWETRTGQNVATLRLPFSLPTLLEWSPTGGFLAVCRNEGQAVGLYQITGRRHVQQWLTGHAVELRCVAAHPRLERLATSGYRELSTWDLATSHPVPVPIGPNPGAAMALAYSPDGSLLAVASWSGANHEITIRDANTGKVQERITGPHICTVLAFDPASGQLASGDVNGRVILWDRATSRPVREFRTGAPVNSIVFLDRPRRLVTHSKDAVLLINLETGEQQRSADLPGGSITRLAADRGRSRMLVGFKSGAIGSLSLPGLTPGTRVDNAADGSVRSLALSPDGRLLATGHDHRVVLHDAVTLETLLGFPSWDGTVMDLTFDVTGRRLAIVGTGNDVDLWDLDALRDELTKLGLAWDQPAPAGMSAADATNRGEDLQPAVQVIRRPGTTGPAVLP